ncbi:MAG TPA: hypothetical protein VM240_09705 [Verrucomicrobiae bacterium]|nr:hypothetical protein [Verrucomicrobiae bacterium]
MNRFAMLVLVAALAGCGVGNDSSRASTVVVPALEPWMEPVPKAACGPDDPVETGLQGQVSSADRASGRSLESFSCNLELVGQYAGEGASWQLAWYDDCAYYDTATGRAPQSGSAKAAQQHPGVAVIDVSDPAAPVATAFLATSAMIDPWESLKVADKRGLLGAANSYNGTGNPDLDLYDVSGDCTQPRLISSAPVAPQGEAAGHEGNFSQDGFTYYIGDRARQHYVAIDVTDPAQPQRLLSWPNLGTTHGLSTNVAGTRAYFSRAANSAGVPNGIVIADTSQVQARQPDPDISVISELYWTDGGQAQQTLPIFIGGTAFVLQVDELGKGAARLINIADETKPAIASRLMLEVHDPANADATAEASEGTIFGYEGHYCGVDSMENTRVVACGYFQSGLRVFDVRNPYKPREIAYYNPPGSPGYKPGSNFNLTGECGTVDWASSMTRIDLARGEIWFTSQCNGFQVVRFTRPLAELLGPVVE